MKFFATLMLMLAFGLSVAYSQDFSDDDASMDAQNFMDRVLKGQVDDEDDEIVDMDDALNKLRMLRKVYRIVADVEAEDLLHPKKRFIADTFKNLGKKLKEFFEKAWKNAKEAFTKAVSKLKEHIDFDGIVDKVIDKIHSNSTVDGCVRIVLHATQAIFGSAASIAGTLAKPVCEGALAKIEESVG